MKSCTDGVVPRLDAAGGGPRRPRRRALPRPGRGPSQAAARLHAGALAGAAAAAAAQRVRALVERFDKRGTEPFELFRSEFGQHSVKIHEFSLENSKFQEKKSEISTSSKISAKFR